jgi:single-strand DNA-binding protein
MNDLRNRVQLIGRLGMNPEIKETESGRKMARTNIATSDHYTNAKGEKVSETQWHNIIAWGKTAEIMEKYLQKGHEILIEGKLMHRQWTDKEGAKRYFTEVQVNSLLMMEKK